MAILRKKAEFENLNVPNEILEYIANNIKSNIRELEGSLTKLTAYAKFTHNDLSIALAEEALRDIIFPNETRDVTPDLIIKTVSDHFNIRLPISHPISAIKRLFTLARLLCIFVAQ